MQNISWEKAICVLRKSISEVTEFSPDLIHERFTERAVELLWRPVSNYLSAEDIEIWQQVSRSIVWPAKSEVIVVIDDCYTEPLSPYQMNLDEIAAWMEDCTQPHVFGGDALFLGEEELLMVHHEGVFTVAPLNIS